MFIRRAKVRSTPAGPVHTARLCQSVRSGSKVRQVTLLNLGVHFAVPQERWHDLAALVSTLDQGGEPLFDPGPELLRTARHIAGQLRQRRLDAAGRPGAEIATVQLAALDHPPSRSVGGERLALAALGELDLAAMLRASGLSRRQAALGTSLVLARMLHPSSEREARRWLAERSAAWELLGLRSSRPPSLNSLYRAGDRLRERRERLERALARRQRSLFDAPRAVAFYDLTNVRCHGQAGGDRQFGRSQQKRSDCPLVTLALAVDEAGCPRCSEVLPGNGSEPGTLKDAIKRLEARSPRGAAKPLAVMDAGLSTEANPDGLKQRGYGWITVQRGQREGPPQEGEPLRLRTRCGLRATVWEVSEPGAAERRVPVWSQGRQAKDDAILKSARKRYEAALQALHEGLGRKGCLKGYDKVVEQAGRLKERHRRVAAQYDVEVRRPPQGSAAARKGHAAAVVWKLNGKGAERDDRAGSYELRTSCTRRPLEAVVRTYWQLAEVEATFRSLKSELGLRPVWHRNKERIRAHLFIAVLACHAVQLLRRKLARQGIHDSWATIRHKLEGWERVTTLLRTVEGRLIENCQDTRPGAEAERIARAVGVEPRRHRKRV